MGVVESLAERQRISIEVVPPSRGGGLEGIMAAVEAIMPHGPAFISVTDHPGGRAWAEAEGGPARVALRTKPGTLGTAVALRDAFQVETVPHIVATGAERLTTEDLLIDLHYAGFRDLFVVKGDERFAPPALGGRTSEDPCVGRLDGYAHAADLVAHVASLNAGRYTPPAEGKPTVFRVGVAGYPQKHFAAPNLEADVRRLKEKVDAGAHFVLTQMVFEAAPYFHFVRRLREVGVEVPVVPGIKPVFKAASLESLPRTFFVDLPQGLVRSLVDARSPAEERAAGLEWTLRLCRDLLEAGAPGLHFFTMGSGAATKAVLDALFGTKGGAS